MQKIYTFLLKTSVLVLLACLFGTVAISATFTELRSPDFSRRLLYNFPVNFNNSAVIFFHGSQSNAEVLLRDAPTADIIQKMLDAGFLVILPESRQDFFLGHYKASWESTTVSNPDTMFIDWIMDTSREILPQLKEIYLMGGGNGVLMSSRMAKNHQDIAGIVSMNGLDADQVVVDLTGNISINENFSITSTHAPILMISTKQDEMALFKDQQIYFDKVKQAGVSAMMIVDETGGHNWGEWTMQYHDDIVGWLKK